MNANTLTKNANRRQQSLESETRIWNWVSGVSACAEESDTEQHIWKPEDVWRQHLRPTENVSGTSQMKGTPQQQNMLVTSEACIETWP